MNHSAAVKLQEQIQTSAQALGLDRIGFAPALPPARAEFFKTWLAQGKAGTMTYLNRSADRRSDPQRVLPGARTIISVAQSYYTGRLPDEIQNDPSRGLIASYAWGRDYHDVLLNKLKDLAAFIEDLAPGHSSRWYTDTGHLLERDHGERAGLGFVGKNTLLISPRIGSTFSLGEILTTLELPPTPPVRMPSCGSCTRCLEICPTHALPTAHVLDSTLCISYLTIEYRGIIPRELRSKMGNHVFGCDDCQDCCPWNDRFSKESGEPAYRSELERQAPGLIDLASLTEEQFRERFAGSAVVRPGYTGFMRNVAVALGNWAEEKAVEPLEKLVESEEPLVRLHAVWALARCASPRAGVILSKIGERDTREDVRAEVDLSSEEREKRARGAPRA